MNIFYLNGKFVPENEAKASILDLGFVRGFGVFDFLRTYHGQPFKLEEHLRRLKNSAQQICLKIPWTTTELSRLVYETLKRNGLPEANIKIVVTGGLSPDQITPGDKPTLAIMVYPPAVYPPSYYTEGIKVVTVPFSRSFCGAKTINYIPAIIAMDKARKEKAVEALYLSPQKEILEGTTTSFFAFKGETLFTAKKDVLPGITQQVILSLAKKEFPVKLQAIKYAEVKNIDEAFITASNKEIMPVVKIDKITVGSGKVGKNTKRLTELFRAYTL